MIPDATEKPDDVTGWINAGTRCKNGNVRKHVGTANKRNERGRIFKGVAEAMAQQWSSYIIEKDKFSEINGHKLPIVEAEREDI